MKIESTYLNKENVVIILSNVLLIVGAIVFKWSPMSVFVLYILETIIIGILHCVKMLVIGLSNDVGSKSKLSFYIPFFFVHFMFFVFVQSSIVLQQNEGAFFGGLGKLFSYIKGDLVYWLILIAVLNLYVIIKDLFFIDRYRGISIDKVMMEPYPRIFVQQFTVIIGAGILMFTGSHWGLLIVFIVTKTIAEILISQNVYEKQSELLG